MNTKLIMTLMVVVIVGLSGYILRQQSIAGLAEPVAALHTETGHDPAAHAETEGEHAIELTPEAIAEIGLETAPAGPGVLDRTLEFPGEIEVNRDRMAHVSPRVEGVVVAVKKNLGDSVAAGETLAVIESRELADAKSGYLAAVAAQEMARRAYGREEKLWREKISAEQEYLDRKQALDAAQIALRTAGQKLLALGLDEAALATLPNEPDRSLTRFEIKAPFDGTVIEKHLVLGESVGTESTVYTLADLSTVWVDLQVYPKDLARIAPGQAVAMRADSAGIATAGTLSYVGPLVGTESRTALARVVLANETGSWRPGLFVTAQVTVGTVQAAVVVPAEAIQTFEGRKCVFIKDAHDFEPAFVEVGLASGSRVEIVSGLAPGQDYVTRGAFALKSKLVTSTLGSHAGHNH